MTPRLLLAVPNVSEGRDAEAIAAIGRAFSDGERANGVRLLDTHSDADHNRSVYTLAGAPRSISEAMLRGARAALERIDVMSEHGRGQHPHVGALDVAPIVYLQDRDRGAACAEALVVADSIGFELGVPVFLYGELADGRTRAVLRRGGVRGLAARIAHDGDPLAPPATAGPMRPDFGPPALHPRAGATLVAAREPLVAFNLCLSPPAGIEDARAIAAAIREGGREGLPGVRAIAISLSDGRAQVSVNVERPLQVPLALVTEVVARLARVSSAELVGLAPRAALEGFPEDIPLVGFDAGRHVIENALGS